MKFNILDVFRGLAALWVFSHHLRSKQGFQQLSPYLVNLFNNGSLGVHMFFVISGFCVMSSMRMAEASQESSASFLFRRAKRVYISFWFSVVFVAAIPFLIQLIGSINTGEYISPDRINLQHYKYLKFSLFDWIQTITLFKIFESPGNIKFLAEKFASINGVYWSLAIEVQFYLVMFLALWFKQKRNLILIVVSAISLLAAVCLPQYKLSGLFVYCWHYFLFGILINYLFKYQIKPSCYPGYRILFQMICLSTICTLLCLLCLNSRLNTAIFIGLFLLLIWSIEIYETKYLEYLGNKNVLFLTLNMLGLMSYSNYLVHAKLIFLTQECLKLLIIQGGLIFLFLSVVLTLAGCYLFYLLCEKPFYKRKVAT